MQVRDYFKRNFVFVTIVLGFMILMFQSIPVSAAEKSIVYTSFTKTVTDTSGDGTKGNPYNRFEDAVKNVADGGTIYIMAANGAFLNEAEGIQPFIINKSVTIEPEPGAGRASLSCRAAGILLEGDVTFRNIELGFANKYHDHIFANGYKLTLINVTRTSGCRLVDLFAGGLYIAGVPIGTEQGKNGQVIVEGRSSEFGNIYAGSLNGAFDGASSICVEDTAAKMIGDIYASGAEETYFDRDNWFDQTEPPIPTPHAGLFPVTGKVQVRTVDTSITNIDGAGAANGTAVSFSAKNLEEYLALNNIATLKVEQGPLKPAVLTAVSGEKINLSVAEGGTLILSNLGDIDVNDFIGGGKLILGKSAVMRIAGTVTGKTAFETEAFLHTNGYSGDAIENHVYIETKPETKGIFSFIPNPNNPTQSNLQLIREENGNWKVVKNTGSIFFSYWTKNEEMGTVSCDWETFNPQTESPTGAFATAKPGYHFVDWIDEKGEVVGTETQYIPEFYYKTHCFEAVFEKDAEPEVPPTEPPVTPPKEEDKEPEVPPTENDTTEEDTKPVEPPIENNTTEEDKESVESTTENGTTEEKVKPILPKTVTGLKAGRITYNSVTLTWKSQQKGIRYYVYRSTKKSSGYKKIATVSKNSYTDKKLTTGKRYYYKVKACFNKNVTKYSKTISVKPVPEKPRVSLRKGKRYVIVKYSKVSGAHGYEIYRSTKKSRGYKRIVTTKKTSYKNRGLKSGKKYYYKVRVYHKEKGKKIYSGFSAVK